MEKNKLIITADGSHTIYVPNLNEHYHSVNGAIQEAKHVYIEAGLNQCTLPAISVLEIGFGTGLDALLTCMEADKRNIQIKYTGIEKHPLPEEIHSQLNYPGYFEGEFIDHTRIETLFRKIHQATWGEWLAITPLFSANKIETDIRTYTLPDAYDVVYYDAFGPDKQPEVWSQEIFDKLFAAMNPEGILTTYCAKGEVRRMLLRAGFSTERIPGPPGKRQMLRAKKMKSQGQRI